MATVQITLKDKGITEYTEHEILRYMLHSKEFVQDFITDLHPNLFQPYLQNLVGIVRIHWRSYAKLPTLDVVNQQLQHVITGSNKEAEIERATNAVIPLFEEPPKNPEFLRDQVLNFLRNQKLENGLTEAM